MKRRCNIVPGLFASVESRRLDLQEYSVGADGNT